MSMVAKDNVSALMATLDRYDERVPLDELQEHMQAYPISYDDIKRYARFNDDGYRRNLLHAGPGYHALILCWKAGQRSPIHDHAASSCGVRVLKGVATETIFKRNADGLVFPTSSHELQEGEVCGSQDADTHQMSNLQTDGKELVTLHIYSPPLMTMSQFSLTSATVSEFVDQVFEFAGGDGI